MQVQLNDTPVGTFLSATTASFYEVKDKRVENLGEMSFQRGMNRLRLSTEGYSPHLMEIAVTGVRKADLQCA